MGTEQGDEDGWSQWLQQQDVEERERAEKMPCPRWLDDFMPRGSVRVGSTII